MVNIKDKQFTKSEKLDYYEGRVNDPNLSDGQRGYAKGRVKALESGSRPNRAGGKSTKKRSGNESTTYTMTVRYGK